MNLNFIDCENVCRNGDYYEADRYYKYFSTVNYFGDGWLQPD